jgi:hypothetical protein
MLRRNRELPEKPTERQNIDGVPMVQRSNFSTARPLPEGSNERTGR